jgi:acyl-CoA thioesterase YciA
VHRWVTVSIERVEFKAPVHIGDVVSLYTKAVQFGRSSITVEVRVVAERWLGGASAEVTAATVKMVAVDRHGKAIDFRSAPTVVEST